jgi:predicted ATPase/DNA-binding SARP family transcriptional activator
VAGHNQPVRIAMLGPLEVSTGAGTPVEVSGVRLRTLLILLALEPGRVVATSRLVDGVWGTTPPAEAANALQALVSRLRRALPDGVVESAPTGYRLAVDADTVDVARFERLLADGRAALDPNPAPAAAVLRSALALWRGTPLADAADADFAQAPVARLAELRLGAVADRIDADLRLAAGVDALVAELEELLAAHPLRERFAALLMRALCRAGRSGDALAVYEKVRTALAEQLGADPSAELADLHVAVLRGDPELTDRPGRPRTNLPAGLTSFVGRDEELGAVAALVAESRLVTLTGPGGSGKTRLATEVARTMAGRQPDGVWLVELAPLTDETELPSAVLAVLGLRVDALTSGPPGFVADADPADRLAAALRTRSALLVLDNCEHVIDGAAALAGRLLGECPALRVLATSREPLGITGESLWPVDPLSLPPADATAERAGEFAAVRLFADRAAAVRPGFTVDDGTVAAVVRICRALDGMPLAIELAAARLRSMPPDQVASRLADRFRLLTAGSRTALPRHQTLRAVVDWSWDLLDDAERAVLRRLAVFTGAATLAAAERVCAGGDVAGPAVFDVLTALVDKSLVITVGDRPRYRMLETIKAYGLERLAEAGEERAVRGAYTEYFAVLAEAAEPHLRTGEQLTWLARLADDHENLHAAIRMAVADGAATTALRMMAAFGWYWWLRGHKTEGADLAAEVFAAFDAGSAVPDELRALALTVGALLAIDGARDQDRAGAWFSEAVELAERGPGRHPLLRAIGPLYEVLSTYGTQSPPVRFPKVAALLEVETDPWTVAMARVLRAHATLNVGKQLAEAEADFRLSLTEFRRTGDRWGISFALTSLGDLLAWRGAFAEAIDLFQEGVEALAQLVSSDDLIRFRLRLVSLHLLVGDHDAAEAELAVAQRETEAMGLPEAIVGVAAAQGDLARLRGDYATARTELAKAAEQARHVTVAPQFQAFVAASVGYLAAAEGDVDTALREHRAAVDWALRSNDAPIIAQTLVGIAEVCLLRGDAARAAELLGASDAIRGTPDKSFVDATRVAAATRAVLGDTAFAQATARGATATPATVEEWLPPT